MGMARRPRLTLDTLAWRYLSERERPYSSAWFAHTDDIGKVTHVKIRGPDVKGSVT